MAALALVGQHPEAIAVAHGQALALQLLEQPSRVRDWLRDPSRDFAFVERLAHFRTSFGKVWVELGERLSFAFDRLGFRSSSRRRGSSQYRSLSGVIAMSSPFSRGVTGRDCVGRV
jgi:hypothetical protein